MKTDAALRAARVAVLVLTASSAVGAQGASNSDGDRLLSELDSTIGELRDVEARGAGIKATRADNRRAMDRLQDEGDTLAAEKARIDTRVAQYNRERETYLGECSGGQPGNQCAARGRQLDALGRELDADAAALTPRFDEYNAQINAYNAQDDTMAGEEEALYAQARQLVSRIESIKGQFTSLAAASGNDALIADVQQCNRLQGFEDTLMCLRTVWRLISSPGVR